MVIRKEFYWIIIGRMIGEKEAFSTTPLGDLKISNNGNVYSIINHVFTCILGVIGI
jgi:hypothetical protein